MILTVLQAWTLFLDHLPSIATFITAMVILWRQSVNVKDTKALVQNSANDNAVAIQGAKQTAVEAKTAAVAAAQSAVEAKLAIAEVHSSVNGRMDELIATTKSDSHAEGMSDQRKETAGSIVIK